MTPSSQNATATRIAHLILGTELLGIKPINKTKESVLSCLLTNWHPNLGLGSLVTLQITRSLDPQNASVWVPTLVSPPREFPSFHASEWVLRICKHFNNNVFFFYLDISLSALRVNSFKLGLRRNTMYIWIPWF